MEGASHAPCGGLVLMSSHINTALYVHAFHSEMELTDISEACDHLSLSRVSSYLITAGEPLMFPLESV